MSADGVVYLDSSAIVKLVVKERESAALPRHLGSRPVRVSSALALVEVVHAVQAHGAPAAGRARQILSAMRLFTIDRALLDAAAGLPQAGLRSLDTIHVASALTIGGDLSELVTYDHRMFEAATAVGLEVTGPAGG